MSSIPPEAFVDHYVFWRFLPLGFSQPVTLHDQFHEAPFDNQFSVVELLGNPARKIRRDHEEEDIHHAKIHLLAYRLVQPIDGPPPENPPIVRHQFNRDGERWVLGMATTLLVPARKVLDSEPPPTTPPPRRVDHYLCYEVLEAPPVREPLALKDQFGTTDTHELRPKLFGVPVNKNNEGYIHPEVHLAIYDLLPGLHPSPPPPPVNTADQLRRWRLSAIESIHLGVPCHKEWEPIR